MNRWPFTLSITDPQGTRELAKVDDHSPDIGTLLVQWTPMGLTLHSISGLVFCKHCGQPMEPGT